MGLAQRALGLLIYGDGHPYGWVGAQRHQSGGPAR